MTDKEYVETMLMWYSRVLGVLEQSDHMDSAECQSFITTCIKKMTIGYNQMVEGDPEELDFTPASKPDEIN
jgi:hypothetical protein